MNNAYAFMWSMSITCFICMCYERTDLFPLKQVPTVISSGNQTVILIICIYVFPVFKTDTSTIYVNAYSFITIRYFTTIQLFQPFTNTKL